MARTKQKKTRKTRTKQRKAHSPKSKLKKSIALRKALKQIKQYIVKNRPSSLGDAIGLALSAAKHLKKKFNPVGNA